MLKGYYLYFKIGDNHIGVESKIKAQIKAFNEYATVALIPVISKTRTFAVKVKSRIPFGSFGFDYETVCGQIEDPDFIYIRPAYVDRGYVLFLKRIKQLFPKVKIVCELYTYPYDRDFYHTFSAIPLFIKDVIHRKKLKRYIDRFATLTNDEFIFGVKTIHIENGIDLEAIPCDYNRRTEQGVIRLLSVAIIQEYHGIERLIEGLHVYYTSGGKRSIIFRVVGYSNDNTLENLKKLSIRYGLQNNIIFTGEKRGEELHELISQSDIGVCSLGLYKLGIQVASPLKSREYLAYGLPMISGCKMYLFDEKDFPYCLEFPNDSTPIDIEKVVSFYDSIYVNNERNTEQIISIIRQFAEENIDIRNAMKEVKDYLWRPAMNSQEKV